MKFPKTFILIGYNFTTVGTNKKIKKVKIFLDFLTLLLLVRESGMGMWKGVT